MKERPILFSAPMVRAILEGRKTQTRRIVKNVYRNNCVTIKKPTKKRCGIEKHVLDASDLCPYGQRGDRLWVRETFAYTGIDGKVIFYRATDSGSLNWRPSIHMPRRASRITLKITDVRVERLQDISGQDCAAEGVQFRGIDDGPSIERGVGMWKETKACYRQLWESINGVGSWDMNPWVWVISFEKVKP